MNTVPFLQSAFLHAFNARRANFLGQPIFDFTFNDGGTILYNGVLYDNPDQLTIASISKQIQNQQTLSLKDENAYDSAFSAEVKGEYTGVTFSGSAYSNLSFKGSLFTSSDVEYSLNRLVYQTYTAQRNVYNNCLDATFAQDLANLPTSIDGNFQEFIDFFDLYGTHFLYNGNFGATIYMQTNADKSLLKTYSEMEIKAGISAGFNGAVASGQLSASTVYSNSTLMSQNQASFSLYFESLGGKLVKDLSQFEQSVAENPVLLLSSFGVLSPATFNPISLLCTDSAQDTLINEAMQSYILLAESQDGLIALPTDIDASVATDLVSDGIVLSTLKVIPPHAQMEQATIETDAITCESCVHYSPIIKALIPDATGTIPAQQSTTLEYTGPVTLSQTKLFSVSVPNTPVFLGWQPVAAGTAQQAATNGLLFAGLSEATEGSHGTVSIAAGDSTATLEQVAGCSVFMNKANLRIPGSSTCCPILKGQYFSITESISGQIGTAYQFIAMDEVASSLSSASDRKMDLQYTATGDGFLLCLVNAPDDSFCTVQTEVNLDNGASIDIVAGASVYRKDTSGISFPVSTTLVPIPKASTYKISYDKTSVLGGTPVVSCWWFDFFPTTETYDENSIKEQEVRLASLALAQ